MDKESNLHRREFLRLSAMAAAGTILAACGGASSQNKATKGTTSGQTTTSSGGSTTASSGGSTASSGGSSTLASKPTPTAQAATDIKYSKGLSYNGKYHESPALAKLVKQGKLPPVEQRLPEHPYVVPHDWVTKGQYGGRMQWICNDTSDWSTTHLITESMYGNSQLRWLKDGLEIGPGMVESWESNKELSTWTLHFRKGMKWSDGKPWTTGDVMFWWEDEVGEPALDVIPSDAVRSGKGNLMKLKQVDDTTVQAVFDSSTPLFADYLALGVNGGIGMRPKHYMQQFHIKYNKKLDPKTWVEKYQSKWDNATNPDYPTMTGWKITKYQKGQFSVWERNPYYYAIDKWGNQLPFMDGLTQTNVQNAEAMKLQIQQGKMDYVHGAYVGLTLADVSTFKQTQSQNKLNILLWDSGSGTASMYFFNYDYYKPKMRKLIRNPKFRQALSLAYDRKNAQKQIYFNTGEATTGTFSPKAIEYHLGKGPQVYKQWRDSWKGYDPDRAKKMLDELGVKDHNGDGVREMPDGSPLKITLDYGTPGSDEHIHKNELLAGDWKKIGLDAKPNPVNSTGFGDRWAEGQILTTTAWEVGDGPNHLVGPWWLVPIEPARWAPLEGVYYSVRGTPKEHQEKNVDPYKRHPPRMEPEKGGPIEKLWNLYDKAKSEPDFMKRNQMVWEMIKIHITDGPFFSGTVANYPQIELVRQGLMNVPKRNQLAQHGMVNTWAHPTPAVYDPEGWYWDNPGDHS